MLILKTTLDGFTALIEPGDTHIDLPELHSPIASLSWDGVWKADGHYHAIYLTNNEFAIEVVIPDADWLDRDLRESLEDQAQKGPPYMKNPSF